MSKHIRLGILTPSSNTSLEPLTQSLIAPLQTVTVHFSRFPVVKISLESDALSQFQTEPILAAARLLADANVDIIGWSGTSSGWLGFEADEALCGAITEATGIPATTSVLALNKACKKFGVERLGLVTPYVDDVQDAIVKTYGSLGIEVSEERHLGLSKNTAFAEIGEEVLDGMVAEVVRGRNSEAKGVQAITTFCTNLRAAQRVSFWEKEHGVPVFDTVATVVWDMLRHCEVNTAPLRDWGVLFRKA
ncbi:Asp/Glu/hydantoin racemase [Aspergillus pseudodeflectus]|uniref:Asp/Glu/hydantoin racemase n=1 Tax=Aspergillus pseudodeflectus TaxID=176178 RepID=A0ABR4L3V0_9EURO